MSKLSFGVIVEGYSDNDKPTKQSLHDAICAAVINAIQAEGFSASTAQISGWSVEDSNNPV